MTREQAKAVTFRVCLPERRALQPRFSVRAGPDGRILLRFCLRKHFYQLQLGHRYCGAIVTNRWFKRGENWLRGNDLRDGRLTRLPMVLLDIVQYEFGFGRWRNRVQTVRQPTYSPYTR